MIFSTIFAQNISTIKKNSGKDFGPNVHRSSCRVHVVLGRFQ